MTTIVLRIAAGAIMAAGTLQAAVAPVPAATPTPTTNGSDAKATPSIPPPYCPTWNGCGGRPY